MFHIKSRLALASGLGALALTLAVGSATAASPSLNALLPAHGTVPGFKIGSPELIIGSPAELVKAMGASGAAAKRQVAVLSKAGFSAAAAEAMVGSKGATENATVYTFSGADGAQQWRDFAIHGAERHTKDPGTRFTVVGAPGEGFLSYGRYKGKRGVAAAYYWSTGHCAYSTVLVLLDASGLTTKQVLAPIDAATGAEIGAARPGCVTLAPQLGSALPEMGDPAVKISDGVSPISRPIGYVKLAVESSQRRAALARLARSGFQQAAGGAIVLNGGEDSVPLVASFRTPAGAERWERYLIGADRASGDDPATQHRFTIAGVTGVGDADLPGGHFAALSFEWVVGHCELREQFNRTSATGGLHAIIAPLAALVKGQLARAKAACG